LRDGGDAQPNRAYLRYLTILGSTASLSAQAPIPDVGSAIVGAQRTDQTENATDLNHVLETVKTGDYRRALSALQLSLPLATTVQARTKNGSVIGFIVNETRTDVADKDGNSGHAVDEKGNPIPAWGSGV
jgi:hypothetical protein